MPQLPKGAIEFFQGFFTTMGQEIVSKIAFVCSDGDSGEAERFFRREAERHSGMNPNTIGAQRRWHFDFARSVRLRQGKTIRNAAKEQRRKRGKGRGERTARPVPTSAHSDPEREQRSG